MKFRIDEDWIKWAAKREAGMEIGAFNPRFKVEHCPKCRGYNLEKQWCDLCEGRGVVKVND